MANASKIEWTESTWNPITGCTKISPGCQNCYAERLAMRLQAMGQPNYINGFRVTTHDHMLNKPLSWKHPQMIFVNSMSDIFHEDVPLEFIIKIFNVMQQAAHHRFQILTKRSERMLELCPELPWPSNVWAGVTVENDDYRFRINHLCQTSAKVKFISFEPLLSPIKKLNLKNIDWVIVGGESGPKARPMLPIWVRDIRDQCFSSNVPFFFKQWGGVNKKRAGRILDGQIWDQMPDISRLKF